MDLKIFLKQVINSPCFVINISLHIRVCNVINIR